MKSARSAGLAATVILLAAGFFWALIQIFAAITMQCEAYFAFWTAGLHSRTSLLQTMSAVAAAVAVWWLGDIVRYKSVRVPVTLRIVQGGLVASMLLVSLVQWGIVFPGGSLAPAANAVIAGYNRAFLVGYFPLVEEEMGPLTDWPHADESWIDFPLRWSEFRIYKGGLECVARREFGAQFDREFWIWPDAVTPPSP